MTHYNAAGKCTNMDICLIKMLWRRAACVQMPHSAPSLLSPGCWLLGHIVNFNIMYGPMAHCPRVTRPKWTKQLTRAGDDGEIFAGHRARVKIPPDAAAQLRDK